MTEDLDKQLREKIGGLIAEAADGAVVWIWDALSRDPAEWPGMFRTDDGGTHGWVIKLAAQTATRKNGARDRVVLTYDIWGFYGFETGNEDENSDHAFTEIIAAVYDKLKGEPRLEFDNEVEYHDLLQFVKLTVIHCGEESLHYAQGRLTVHLCC